jgi:hypothetical protein
MRKSSGWIWKAYFIIYLYLTIGSLYAFFSPSMPAYWYHQILIAYDAVFLVPYFLNAASLFFNALAVVVIYLFIARISILSQRFWAYTFFLRLILEFFGKSYERKIIEALFHDDPATGWLAIGMMVSLALPSYVAYYLYAFKRQT